MRIIIFLSVLFFIASTAKSQILKINRNDLAVDTSQVLFGSVNLNVNTNNQSATAEENLVYTGIEFGSNLTYLSKHHAYLLINSLKYFRITGGPLVSTGHAHVRANLQRKEALSYELFTQVQYDEGRRMPLRYLFGSGLRMRILSGNKGTLYAGVGIMNEFERWRPFNEEEVIEKQLWKNTSYLSGNIIISDNFKIDIINYYQGGHDDETDDFRHRISGDITLNAKITGRLAFTTNFVIMYDSDPIIEINPFVYSLTNGLKLNF